MIDIYFSALIRELLVGSEGTKGRRCCRCSMRPRSESSQSSLPPGPRSGDGRVWRNRGRDAAASHTPAYLVNTRHDNTYPLNKPQSSNIIEAKVLQQIITLEMVLINWTLKVYVLKYSIESNICKKTKSGKVDKFCAL